MMVVSVLERSSEIGVRRALGATKRHIRLQFLTEAVLLALLGGGLLGTLLGIAVTYGYADVRDITFSVPPTAVALGVGAALVVGGLAGLSPAARAAPAPTRRRPAGRPDPLRTPWPDPTANSTQRAAPRGGDCGDGRPAVRER